MVEDRTEDQWDVGKRFWGLMTLKKCFMSSIGKEICCQSHIFYISTDINPLSSAPFMVHASLPYENVSLVSAL